MDSFSRCSFIKSFGAFGRGMGFIPTPVTAAMRLAEVLHLVDRTRRFCETRTFLGTQVSITALHESKDAAVHAVNMAFDEIERLAAVFDRHQSDTPVSFLNETGRLNDVAPELREVVEKVKSFYRRTDGTFDATILPVLDMLKSCSGHGSGISLTKSDLDDAFALVGSESIRISDDEISFDRQGMAITLDGIGRGYILDRASEVLAANGVENHLLNAGGDILARGESSPGQPWIVAIEDPGGSGAYPAVIRIKDAAVSTSGGPEFYLNAQQAFHSAADHTSTFTARKGVSVSVVAPTAMEADALSTSAFAMSPTDAIRFINAQLGTESLIAGSSGFRYSSSDWDTLVGI